MNAKTGTGLLVYRHLVFVEVPVELYCCPTVTTGILTNEACARRFFNSVASSFLASESPAVRGDPRGPRQESC